MFKNSDFQESVVMNITTLTDPLSYYKCHKKLLLNMLFEGPQQNNCCLIRPARPTIRQQMLEESS